MTSSVEMVGAGCDTLVMNVYPTDELFRIMQRRVDAELQRELTVLKQRAQDEEEDIETRFVFNGSPLLMRTKGSEGFNWILHNSSLTLAVNRGSKMAILGQVRCSSEYLWSVHHEDGIQDLGKAISAVHVFLMSVFGDYIVLQPSAYDLAVDVVNLDLNTIEGVKEYFITRAQLDDEMPLDAREVDWMIDGPDSIKRRWRRVTGLSFGSRNGQVSALIYDKTHEIKYKSPNKTWFHDLWRTKKHEDGSPVWDEESPVVRIELRFKRRALHEFKCDEEFHGIESAYQLDEVTPGLWAYAVGHVGGGADDLPDGWLRYVVPTDDTNRSRWPVHPDWEVIQRAFIPQPLPESDVEREERERVEYLRLADEELAARPLSAKKVKVSACRKPAAPVQTSSVPPAAPAFDIKPFIRKRHYEVNMYRMVAQIAGCMETAEAWRRLGPDEEQLGNGVEPDIKLTFHYLYKHVKAYMEEKDRVFPERVQKKRVLYSVEKVKA